MASRDPVCAAPSPFPCLLPTPLCSLTSRPNRQRAPLRASAGYPGAGAVGSRQGGGTAGRCPDSPPPPRPPPAPGARSRGAALRCPQSSRRQRPVSPCAPAAAPFVRGASASRVGGRASGWTGGAERGSPGSPRLHPVDSAASAPERLPAGPRLAGGGPMLGAAPGLLDAGCSCRGPAEHSLAEGWDPRELSRSGLSVLG